MSKSREGLLFKGDVEGDAKEVGSGKGDVEVEEGGLWYCPIRSVFLSIEDLTINWPQHATN